MVDESSTFGQSFGDNFGASLSASTDQLIRDCLIATGIQENNTTYRARALTLLNHAYLHILQGRQWNFMHRELTFELKPPYETGTVAVTQDSSSVEESVDVGAVPVISWNSGILGQAFTSSDGTVYRILSHDSLNSLTLVTDYTGESATLADYKILYDRYTMTAHVQEPRSLVIHGFGEIDLVSREIFRNRKAANPSLVGTPRSATIVQIDEENGLAIIEFYPSPEKRYSATLEYTTRAVRLEDSETSFPMIPPEHMPALFYAGVAELYRLQNNPAMAADAGRKAATAFTRLAADHKATDPVARVQHRRPYFTRRTRGRGYFGLKWFGKVDD